MDTLIRLERDQEELIGQLGRLTPEQLRERPASTKWNVLEILYHVYLSEAATLGYIRKKLKYSPEGLPNATVASKLKTMILQWTLKTPLKFKAPLGLDVFPEELEIEKIDAVWKASRIEFIKLVETLSESQQQSQLFKHPVIGRLDLADTVRFLWAHYLHHKRQIHRLIS